MSVLAILIQKSTLLPAKHADYPREDMSLMEEGDLDPDYFWLIKNTPYPEPMYDTRIYEIKDIFPLGQELLECPPHPVYPQHKAYNHTFKLVKRSNAEIIVFIENAEIAANNLLNSEAQHKDSFVFMMSSINKRAQGYALTEMEQESANKLDLLVVKLAKNASEKANKIALLEAGLIPEIETGWEKSL